MHNIAHARTCYSQKTCTDCPLRSGCSIRASFYFSDKEYSEIIKKTNDATLVFGSCCGCNIGPLVAQISQLENSLNEKRKHEMELHPIYSVE